jgi:5-formyltetrahydrofolate cyclo-ligase
MSPDKSQADTSQADKLQADKIQADKIQADKIQADKIQARTAAFARRKLAHNTGLDIHAQAHLRAALAPFAGRVLAGFMPIRTEIDPLPVMSDWTAPVGVPVIQGKGQALVFHRWTPACDMITGPFGARVPAEAQEVTPQVLIVPLVAFDSAGNRLGYGGGFYDRTLEALRAQRDTIAIGYAYSAQRAEGLPLEPTDQPLDFMVTDQGVQEFRR